MCHSEKLQYSRRCFVAAKLAGESASMRSWYGRRAVREPAGHDSEEPSECSWTGHPPAEQSSPLLNCCPFLSVVLQANGSLGSV